MENKTTEELWQYIHQTDINGRPVSPAQYVNAKKELEKRGISVNDTKGK